MQKFVKENKVFLSIWGLWIIINFAMWAAPSYANGKENFFPNSDSHSISGVWNLPEVLIYGFGSLFVFIIYKVLKEEIAQK